MYTALFQDILIGEGDTRELSGGGHEVAGPEAVGREVTRKAK